MNAPATLVGPLAGVVVETKTVMDDLLAAIGAFEHEVRREIGP